MVKGKGKRKQKSPSVRALVKKEMSRAVETKHKSFEAPAFVDIGALSGTLTEISSISQGVGDSNRVGNRIDVKKIYIQKLLRVEDNTSVPHSTIRVLLVQSRGGVLTTADMPNLMTAVDLDKMYVLKDHLYNLSSTGQNSTGTYFGSPYIRIKWDVKNLPKKVLQYDDSTAANQNNPIYLYMFCDNAYGQQGGFETIYYKDA